MEAPGNDNGASASQEVTGEQVYLTALCTVRPGAISSSPSLQYLQFTEEAGIEIELVDEQSGTCGD